MMMTSHPVRNRLARLRKAAPGRAGAAQGWGLTVGDEVGGRLGGREEAEEGHGRVCACAGGGLVMCVCVYVRAAAGVLLLTDFPWAIGFPGFLLF